MEIKLSNGGVALIDDCDVDKISRYRYWYRMTIGYACGYSQGESKRKRVLMHRIILNAPNGKSVDHVSGDKLDNRRLNLRFATQKQNMRNTKIHRDSRSGIKGVSYFNYGPYQREKKWKASIYIDGHTRTLGYFLTKEEAAEAYDKAAIQYYGEFARTNKMEEIDG